MEQTDRILHFIAQGVINIRGGLTRIEADSQVHRAMVEACEVFPKLIEERDALRKAAMKTRSLLRSIRRSDESNPAFTLSVNHHAGVRRELHRLDRILDRRGGVEMRKPDYEPGDLVVSRFLVLHRVAFTTIDRFDNEWLTLHDGREKLAGDFKRYNPDDHGSVAAGCEGCGTIGITEYDLERVNAIRRVDPL